MERLKYYPEVKPAPNPTFFVCVSVSGAGLTTVIDNVRELGLARLAPPQFTTRKLRPTEQRGDQYYSTTKDVLAKVPNQVALQSEFYGNEYGFFLPAITKIKKMLQVENVIVDNGNLPSEWHQVFDDQFPIKSIFFAPKSPFIAIDRIIQRAKKTGGVISKEDILRRANDNARTIQSINCYDYLVDTTRFEDIAPALISIIETHSFHSSKIHQKAKSVDESQEYIANILQAYAVDPTNYILGMSI